MRYLLRQIQFLQHFGQEPAIAVGESDVNQHEVGLLFKEVLHGIGPAVEDLHIVASPGEADVNGLGQEGVIIYDQDSLTAHLRLPWRESL